MLNVRAVYNPIKKTPELGKEGIKLASTLLHDPIYWVFTVYNF